MGDSLWMDVGTEDRLLEEATRRRMRFASMVATADPLVAQRAADFAGAAPNASPGLVSAAAQEGMDHDAFLEVAGYDGGGWSSMVSRAAGFVTDVGDIVYEQAIKPAIRGAFTVAEGLAQELVQRPLTAALTAGDEPGGFSEAYEDYGDSALRNIVQGDIATTDEQGAPIEGGSLGTGFFAGGGAQARSEQERTLTVDGREANLGRALPSSRLTGAIFGYDSTAYNTVAGVSQFAADVLLDPLALVTGGSSTAARAAGRVGMVADGGRGQRLIEGGLSGMRADARVLDAGRASDLLDTVDPEFAAAAREAGSAGAALRATDDASSLTARPLNPGATSAGQVDAAAQLLAAAGGLSARGRNTVLVEKAINFFGDRNLLSELASPKNDAYTLWQSFKRSSANHVDARLVRDLGAATDETTVSRILLDAVQRGQVTEKGFYSGLQGFRKTVSNSRLTGTSARGRVSAEDLTDSADKLDSFMRQGRVDRDTRASIFKRLIDIEDAPWEERTELFFKVTEDAMASVSENLSEEVELITRMVRTAKGDADHLREFGFDAAGDPIATPLFKSKVDPGTGEEIATIGPQTTAELADVGFELADVTAVRRAAGRLRRADQLHRLWGVKDAGGDITRYVTRELFKPAAILRPAYVVRIGLEEQFRLAAAGYDSLFTHPARFIMANVLTQNKNLATGRTARAARAVLNEDGSIRRPGRGAVDDTGGVGTIDTSLGGDHWEDVGDGLTALNRRAHNVTSDPVQGRARLFTQMNKPVEAPTTAYISAWQHELAQLSASREVRWLARNGGDLDGFVDWARNTAEGRQNILRISRVDEYAQDLLTSDEAVREWGQSINVRLAAKTGGEVGEDGVVHALGDQELLDAISDGRLSGIRLSDQRDPSKTGVANLHRMLRSKYDVAPKKIKAELKDEAAGNHEGRLGAFVDGLFDTFTGKPTNTLARYPVFRQAYIKRAGESMSALADDTVRGDLARQIDEAFTLTKAEKADLVTAMKRAKGSSGFYDDITELDEVLKVRAASEVKELLFDVTKRSNFQDTYEVALPFFDAWKEVTTTWGRLVKDNPAFFIKGGQGYTSLQDSGVVYANDFGEEVFAYPGGGMLSRFFGNDDASLRLEGRVQGANLVAQGIGPGFGPVVQWAVGALMPDTREWGEVREWMAPFGTGGVESAGDLADPAGAFSSLIPAWARKSFNAVSSGKVDEVQWNGTIGDVMKVLAESGRYDPANPDDKQRLLDDAKRGGKFVLLLRSFTQAFGLTGASATFEMDAPIDEAAIPTDWDPEADPDGRWHTIGTLGSEFHRLAEFYDGDYTAATEAFTGMYGLEPHYLTQAKTRSLGEFPVTTEGDYWMKDHEDFARRHVGVAGYFAPADADVELDYAVYRRQIDDGTRESLTPEQQGALANQSRARSMYYAARDKLEVLPHGQKMTALRQVKGMLDSQFPGWQEPVLGVGESMDQATRIKNLAEAAYDPDVEGEPVTEPLRIYFNARARLLEAAAGRGYVSLNNEGSDDLRIGLEQVGQRLSAEFPAFTGVWSQLLAREVEA